MTHKLREIICTADKTILNPLLEPGVRATVSVTGVTPEGDTVPLAPESVKWTVRTLFTYEDDEVVSVGSDGVVTPVNGGYACVEACYTGAGRSLTDSVKIIVRPFYHEYHKAITGKLFLAMEPFESLNEERSGERDEYTFTTFEEALDIIRRLDEVTCGIPKIIYLVGWQRGGHDHMYPALNEVNPRLKRAQDADARESLRWLMREGRRYHTTVSLHINLSDAYKTSPLWREYLDNRVLTENEDGSLRAVGDFAGDGIYPYAVCQKRLLETGFFHRRIAELLELVPELRDSHTLHIDNWVAAGSPKLGIPKKADEAAIRDMFVALREMGLDVTSEGSFHGREQPMTGLQPMTWWDTPYHPSEMPAALYCGGRSGRIDGDPRFGDNIHLENAIRVNLRRGMDPLLGLQDEFCLYTLPWCFLNAHRVESFDGETAVYEDGVRAYMKNGLPVIFWKDTMIRRGNVVFVPMLWTGEREIMAYAYRETYLETKLPEGWEDVTGVDLYEVDPLGRKAPVRAQENYPVGEGRIKLPIQTRTAYVIRPHRAQAG